MKKYKKIILIIVIVIAICFLSFTFVSRVIYHRSNMATCAEIYLRIAGTKKKFQEGGYEKFIKTKYDDDSYEFPDVKLSNNLDSFILDGSIVYTLNHNHEYEKIIVYIHGGAYVNDITSNHLKLLDKIASNENVMIYIPIYPLAPEHTYEDSYELLTDLYQVLLMEEKEIIFMGDSAGGGLALSFAEYTKELELKSPDKLILLSPWLDITMENKDILDYEGKDPMLSSYGLKEMGKLWVGSLDTKDYKVSPIYGDVSNLQNVYLFVGTREIFYPDVNEFFKILQENHITSKLYVGEGLNHVYPVYPIPEANEAVKQICDINFKVNPQLCWGQRKTYSFAQSNKNPTQT